ncbi:hypothetical protein Dimus_024700 [Dionaea muscipula]
MKNMAPRFGKRDTICFMDLTYMDHLLTRRLLNLPRVMLRHMTYVISVPSHELPYGDWLTRVFETYNVPLDGKQGEEPKSYDYFEETFLSMCQLKREHRVWWLGTGENRRKDDENEGGEEILREAEVRESGSGEKFYDVDDEVQGFADEIVEVLEVPTPISDQQKEKTTAGVDPSDPTGGIPDSEFLKLQAEFDRIRAERLQAELDHARAENARLQALLQQETPQPKP